MRGHARNTRACISFRHGVSTDGQPRSVTNKVIHLVGMGMSTTLVGLGPPLRGNSRSIFLCAAAFKID